MVLFVTVSASVAWPAVLSAGTSFQPIMRAWNWFGPRSCLRAATAIDVPARPTARAMPTAYRRRFLVIEPLLRLRRVPLRGVGRTIRGLPRDGFRRLRLQPG